MKKTIIATLCIFVLASCSKLNTSTNGGTWTLHSQTYHATQAYYVLGGLVAYTGTGVPTGSFTIWFTDTVHKDYDTNTKTSWPPRYSTYELGTVYPPIAGKAFIQLTDSSVYESYVITGSTTPNISVAFNKDSSLVTVTIPPVMVKNIRGVSPIDNSTFGKPSGTDSSLVSGTIIQTQ